MSRNLSQNVSMALRIICSMLWRSMLNRMWTPQLPLRRPPADAPLISLIQLAPLSHYDSIFIFCLPKWLNLFISNLSDTSFSSSVYWQYLLLITNYSSHNTSLFTKSQSNYGIASNVFSHCKGNQRPNHLEDTIYSEFD